MGTTGKMSQPYSCSAECTPNPNPKLSQFFWLVLGFVLVVHSAGQKYHWLIFLVVPVGPQRTPFNNIPSGIRRIQNQENVFFPLKAFIQSASSSRTHILCLVKSPHPRPSMNRFVKRYFCQQFRDEEADNVNILKCQSPESIPVLFLWLQDQNKICSRT